MGSQSFGVGDLVLTALSVSLLGGGVVSAPARSAEQFIDHGVAAPVANNRSAGCCHDADGKPLFVACTLQSGPNRFLLVIDPETGRAEQCPFPKGVAGSPFCSMVSRAGRFYTSAGRTFIEFGPGTRRYTFTGKGPASESSFHSFAEGPDGTIYAGSYPHAHLIAFNPKTRKLIDYGSMDPEQMYLFGLAADDQGWVYCGIGTARANLVAYHPGKGQRRPLVDDAARQVGSGYVHVGTDGQIYGRVARQWFRLNDGRAHPIDADHVRPNRFKGGDGSGFAGVWGIFSDGRRVPRFSVIDRWLDLLDPKTGKTRRVSFDYKTTGANVRTLVAGPDGKIYGSSSQPLRFFAYDPGTGRLEDRGEAMPGKGNICAFAIQGQSIAMASYCGGYFYVYDTDRPWDPTGRSAARNPRPIAHFPKHIGRPRTVLAHPDGHHVLMAGYMGYGHRGSGIGIVDQDTGQTTLLTHEQIIPEQSTVTLRAVSGQLLVGGTSVETPGGAKPAATEGELYLLDWASKRIVYRTVPVPKARQVYLVEVAPDGMVHGLASGSVYFVFDPHRRRVIHRADLARYGGLVHNGLALGADGMLYVLLTKSILRIDPRSRRCTKLADAPGAISAGIAIQAGRIYFGCGSHLWSVAMPSRSATSRAARD